MIAYSDTFVYVKNVKYHLNRDGIKRGDSLYDETFFELRGFKDCDSIIVDDEETKRELIYKLIA